MLAVIFVSVFFPNMVPFDDWWKTVTSSVGIFEFSKPTIGLFMLGAMLFSIFVGFPISFTLIFLAFTFGSWGAGSALTFYLMTLQTNSVMLDDQLVAVPLFIFMGIMMEQAGPHGKAFQGRSADDVANTRCALHCGIVRFHDLRRRHRHRGASVTILGIMAAKTMNKSGYDVRLAAGTITAGGTLGILIPPSIMLIVMGPVLEVPVTDLFRAAIIPGILLAVLYMVYAIGRCMINPNLGPILPADEQPETSPYYLLEVIGVMASICCAELPVGCRRVRRASPSFPLGGLILPILWLAIHVLRLYVDPQDQAGRVLFLGPLV